MGKGKSAQKKKNIVINHIENSEHSIKKRRSDDDADIFEKRIKKRKERVLASYPKVTDGSIPESVNLVATGSTEKGNGQQQRVLQKKETSRNVIEEVSEVTFNMTPAQQWNDNQMTLKKDNGRMVREIDLFVKGVLFKNYKFITNQNEMEFSEKKKSLCQYTCTQLFIPEDNRRYWWDHWSRQIEKILSRRRSDVNTGIKMSFIGKCFWILLFYTTKFLTLFL